MMLKYINSRFFDNPNIENIGYFSFLIGLFLLASAVGISVFFLLISLLISLLKPYKYLKDKWNYPFLISALFMCISTVIHFNKYEYNTELNLDPKLSLLGLINWIPLFLSFWGFQKYLNNDHKRVMAAKFLIFGSIPVIFSGILQLLNINGPFEIFNGLIVWFQKPISDIGSLSGLFNNQNYAGLWMVMIWPFCLAELLKENRERIKKFTLIIICILFVIFITLTDSRNALLGLIISTPIVYGSSSLIWYLPSLLLGFSILALTVLPIFPSEIQVFMKSIIPSRIYTLFPEIGLKYLNSYPRVSKWIAALSYIIDKPIFGWGAASFPILYQLKTGEWFGHAHNLPLELAVSYGFLPSFIIFITYLYLLFLSYKKIFNEENKLTYKNPYNATRKAWFASSLIFFLSHQVDIQYFDVRISILCWILLAGLRSLLNDQQVKMSE